MQVPELTVEHLITASNLIRVASNRGAYKLPQYPQAFRAYNDIVSVVKAVKEEGKSVKNALSVETAKGAHGIIEFAANSNGFDLGDYGLVTSIILVLANHLQQQPSLDGVEEKKES